MEQLTPRNGLSPFLQALLAGALLAIVFSVGIFVGKNGGDTNVRITTPDGIQLNGLPRDKVDCLKWVSENFKDPSAGTYSLICHGRLP